MMRWAVIACRVVLGLLFLWAAATKLPDMNAFAQDVANYRLVPGALVPFVAASVVGIEIVAGLALLTGIAARAAAVVVSALLIAFIAFLAQALLRGIDLRCGCFGGDEVASWWTVGRDLVMLAGSVLVAVTPPMRQSAARQPAARAAR